jgi:ABC-2 type transport system permease protein
MSFIPPFTPLMMMLRQAAPGGIPAWQPWVGLVGLAACTVVALWAAARIFRIGLLAQGKTPTMAEMLRWAVKG